MFLFATAGAANFGVHAQGGNFWLEFYLLANDNNQPGALLPYVNCMDQAAMLELSCSLLGGFSSTSWLHQQPFGYINTTHLVGVRTFAGHLIDVNNPFFGTDSTRALVDINDGGRSGFGVHVYVGHSKPLDRRNDGIYDACGGPHTGTETIAQYVTSSIDTHTGLYQVNHTYPGTVNNVAEGVGVIGIDGQNAGIQLWRTKALLTESLSRLVNTAVDNVGTLAHVDWARLPIWLKGTLGDSWDVQYGRVTVSEAEAQAFWLISDANARDSPIRVHVNVVSVITQDGHLDMEASMAVVREHIGHILTSTERDEDVWTSRILPGLEEASLQYADNIAAGRILVVAENVVMDIMGMTSTEALLPYALKLLNKTVRRNRSPPVVPVLRREVITMGIDTDGGATTFRELEAETDVITITGIDTRFSVVFSVGCEIAAADAACDGTGVLFDRHTVAEPGSGEGRTVEFFFIVREVGRHCVHMYVVDLETMVEATSALEVEVVSA
jgi:hypothetical protein